MIPKYKLKKIVYQRGDIMRYYNIEVLDIENNYLIFGNQKYCIIEIYKILEDLLPKFCKVIDIHIKYVTSDLDLFIIDYIEIEE